MSVEASEQIMKKAVPHATFPHPQTAGWEKSNRRMAPMGRPKHSLLVRGAQCHLPSPRLLSSPCNTALTRSTPCFRAPAELRGGNLQCNCTHRGTQQSGAGRGCAVPHRTQLSSCTLSRKLSRILGTFIFCLRLLDALM